MNNVNKTGLLVLALLIAVVTFVPARYSHADTYVVTESPRVIREYTPPTAVIHEYTAPPTIVHEYTRPSVVVREYTPPTVVREYAPTVVIR